MSIRINNNQPYEPNYAEQLNRKQKGTDEADNNPDVYDKNGIYIQDEYVRSGATDRKPADADNADSDNSNADNAVAGNAGDNKSKKPEAKVIGSTDKVDREIKQLKSKKAQLEQQLKTVSEDAEKTAEIERKIMEVESELQQKDNDTYRKQHMETVDCYV